MAMTSSSHPPEKRIQRKQREESAPECWALGRACYFLLCVCPCPCILALNFRCESGNMCVQEGRCSGREMVLCTPKCLTFFGGREVDVTAPLHHLAPQGV